jgi:hypothetical protein
MLTWAVHTCCVACVLVCMQLHRYSADGSLLAVGSHDRNIYLYSVAAESSTSATLRHTLKFTLAGHNRSVAATTANDMSYTQILLLTDTQKMCFWLQHYTALLC